MANRLRRKETAEMMTSAEVCDYLHIGKTTLQTLRNSGKIGYYQDRRRQCQVSCHRDYPLYGAERYSYKS